MMRRALVARSNDGTSTRRTSSTAWVLRTLISDTAGLRPFIASTGSAYQGSNPVFWAPFARSFFGNLQCLYSVCRGNPAMAINGRRNKPFGPGGSTRRLHPSPQPDPAGSGLRRGRNRIDEGVKDGLLLGMVPPLSG